MSWKTLDLSPSGITDYVKEYRYTDSSFVSPESQTVYYVYTNQSVGDTGFGYTFERSTLSSGNWYRHRYARTWCMVLRFTGTFQTFAPASAAEYTNYRIYLPWYRKKDIDLKFCILTGTVPSGTQAAYQYLMGLSADCSFNASADQTISLTEAQLNNVITYGIALVPTREASISEISDYVNINGDSYNTRTFENGAQILRSTASCRYDVQNLASPGTASAVTPSQASILVANRDNVISWTYTQEFAAAQYYVGITATDLSTGAVTAICRKAVITAESGAVSSYTIPADTFSIGKIRLTISVMPEAAADHYADSDAVWTSGTSVEYTVKYAPTASSVTCDGKPVPTVAWESTAQAAFQVRFGDYDSGVRIGSTAEYTVPKIFDDGTYAVSVRTATAAGEWSDWTEETYVTVANTALSGELTVSAEIFGANILVGWESTVSTPDNFALFRDGVLIAVTMGLSFVDRFANGTAVYTVYAVKDGNYIASNPVSFMLKLTTDRISSDEGYTYKPLKYTPSPKSQTDAMSEDVSYHYYSGRTKPIAISGGQTERTKQFLYIFRKRTEVEFLRALAGHPVLLKTTRGSVIYGILNDLQITEARLTTVSFSVREIHREGEEVDYVP